MNLFQDKFKLEALVKTGVAMVLGFCLGVAHAPALIAPSMGNLVALVVTILVLVLPKCVFVFAGMMSALLSLFVLGCLATSMLLSCPSDGLMLGIYAVYALIITTLFYGKKSFDKPAAVIDALIVMPAMFATNFRLLVREGVVTAGSLWLERGTTNGLATYRNLLIAVCWSILITAVGFCVPPIRTLKWVQGQVAIPSALKHAAELLQTAQDDDDDDDGEQQQEQLDKKKVCIHDASGISADKAKMLVFEPRILKCRFFEYLVPQLQDLLAQTEKVVLSSLICTRREGLEPTIKTLQECASALSQNKPLEEKKKQDGEDEEAKGAMKLEDFSSYAEFMEFRSDRLRQATAAWLEALSNPSGNDFQNIKKIYLPWIIAGLSPLLGIIYAIYSFIKIEKPSWFKVGYSIKLTVGYVALFGMNIFWKNYATFRIQTSDIPIGSLFAGWNLIAYAFSWLTTLEGTVKKGLQRALGTALGSFSGWLGIIVCSGSYDQTAPVNRFGLAAWLSVTSIIAIAFSIDGGFPAMMGPDPDHGFTGLYFLLTQPLVAIDVVLGTGSRDDVTINRIVANLSGVAIAIAIAFFPPFIRGGDSRHAVGYKALLKKALDSLIQNIAENKSSKEDTMKSFNSDMKEVQNIAENKSSKEDTMKSFNSDMKEVKLRGKAVFTFHKDANKLQILPFLRVDKRLHPVIEKLLVAESMIDRVGAYCEMHDNFDSLAPQAAAYRSSDLDGEETSDFAVMCRAIEKLLQEAEASLGEIPRSKIGQSPFANG